MNTLHIAKVCHETNRVYCETLGDNSQPQWECAPEWQKASAVAGVEFHMKNPSASADASHNEWMRHKKAEGWVYGPVKDPAKKEHPCMVPWEELPVEQRRKDVLFKNVVEAFRYE